MRVDCLDPNYRECHPALAIKHSHEICNSQAVMDRRNASTRRGNIKSVGNLFKRMPFYVCTSHAHRQHRRNPILEPPVSIGIARSHLLSGATMNWAWASWNGSKGGHTEVMPQFGRSGQNARRSTGPSIHSGGTVVPFTAALGLHILGMNSTRGRAVQRTPCVLMSAGRLFFDCLHRRWTDQCRSGATTGYLRRLATDTEEPSNPDVQGVIATYSASRFRDQILGAQRPCTQRNRDVRNQQ